MSKLSLKFNSTDGVISLERVEFKASFDAELIVSLRGSNGGFVGSGGSFVWSSAVQALCQLFLRYKIDQRISASGSIGEEAALVGGKGSAASSLDYALSKQPVWLIDMFGSTAAGEPRAKLLFLRINSECKRPGPVSIYVNRKTIDPANLHIWIQSTEIEDPKVLTGLEQHLASCWRGIRRENNSQLVSTSAAKRGNAPETSPGGFALREESFGKLLPDGIDPTERILVKPYVVEALQMMRTTNIFSLEGIRGIKTEALANSSFKRLAGKHASALITLDDELLPSERLGTFQDHSHIESLRAGQTLEVAVSPAHIGTMIIFLFLRDVLSLPIKINFRFAHSVEMARRILDRSFHLAPDICSLTIATAATVLGRGKQIEYNPMMFAPSMTHGIVRAAYRGKQNATQVEYLMMTDIPATESFIFDQLVDRRNVVPGNCSVRNAEPDRVGEELRSGNADVRAIIGFPHYVFQSAFNHAELSKDHDPLTLAKETLFFAHQSLCADPIRMRAIKIAIRDAWLKLRTAPHVVNAMVLKLFREKEYVEFMARCTGVQMEPSDHVAT